MRSMLRRFLHAIFPIVDRFIALYILILVICLFYLSMTGTPIMEDTKGATRILVEIDCSFPAHAQIRWGRKCDDVLGWGKDFNASLMFGNLNAEGDRPFPGMKVLNGKPFWRIDPVGCRKVTVASNRRIDWFEKGPIAEERDGHFLRFLYDITEEVRESGSIELGFDTIYKSSLYSDRVIVAFSTVGVKQFESTLHVPNSVLARDIHPTDSNERLRTKDTMYRSLMVEDSGVIRRAMHQRCSAELISRRSMKIEEILRNVSWILIGAMLTGLGVRIRSLFFSTDS
jgi:hypothetical protein